MKRHLFHLFQDRFFENETNIYQVQGLLAVPGLLVAMYLVPQFMELAFRPPGAEVDWVLRTDRLFFPAYSFAVVAFATLFEWDMLFPDRRDFLILATFPIRLRDLFCAKLTALGAFLAAIVVAVNGFSVLLLPVFSAYVRQAHAAGVFRLLLAQIAATGTAALFAFFAVAGLQGVLINLLSPKLFRRISTSVQVFGMSTSVLCLLLFPIYASALRPLAQTHPDWLRYFPPYWFVGIYDVVLPHSNPLFAGLGLFAIKALGVAIGLFCITWTAGFARHYRRTLETEIIPKRVPGLHILDPWLRSPEERAIFRFSGATLARSSKHKLFLATYISAGIAIGVLFALVVRNGSIAISPDGLRALPLFVTFFVISGFRAAFQFPAELSANWLFQTTEASWREASRRATRKRVLVSGLVPTLLLFFPVDIVAWGLPLSVFHFVFQLVTGALLIELLFWTFDKVPFTCSYSPGRMNLAVLVALYLYGFTNYSFRMADLEAWLENSVLYSILFFVVAAAALSILWKRSCALESVRFDASDPEFQTLDLT